MTTDSAPAIAGVLETALYAEDLGPTARFYRDVLGLEAFAEESDRHVFFRVGRGVFLLFNPARTSRPPSGAEGPPVPPHGAFGPGHVAFAVSRPELAQWRDRLHAADVAIESEVAWPGGGTSLYFRDPAGNSVELATPALWGLPDPKAPARGRR